jgi:hypothetical protein
MYSPIGFGEAALASACGFGARSAGAGDDGGVCRDDRDGVGVGGLASRFGCETIAIVWHAGHLTLSPVNASGNRPLRPQLGQVKGMDMSTLAISGRTLTLVDRVEKPGKGGSPGTGGGSVGRASCEGRPLN